MSAQRKNPTAEVKRSTLVHLLKKHALRTFVETGTYLGQTAAALAKHAEKVWTIELDPCLWEKAKEKLHSQENICCLKGCSGELLGKVLEQANQPALLWLDGHFSGAGTAKGKATSPLVEELEQVIVSAHAQSHVILIDDLRLFGSDGYPEIEQVTAMLGQGLPKHTIRCHRDMMFVEPPVDRMNVPDEVAACARLWELQPAASSDGSYLLAAGPCYDAAAAWREGVDDVDRVTAVRVNWCARFGNSVRQVANAFRVAEAHGLKTIYLPGMWWLSPGVHELGNGMRLVNHPGVCFDDEEIVLSGVFFDLSQLVGFEAARMSDQETMGYLEPLLKVHSESEPLPESHLVIHVRGGDVFRGKNVHRNYGQPPLAYYLKILEHAAWTVVTVVAEDQANPVWKPLLDACTARFPCEVRVGMPLADDVGFLLRAKTLVAGRGSFIRAIATLSRNLRVVHAFETGIADLRGIDVEVTGWHDVAGVYRDSLMRGNWENSPVQRELMIGYPQAMIQQGRST